MQVGSYSVDTKRMSTSYQDYGTVRTNEKKLYSRMRFISDLPDKFTPSFNSEDRVSSVTVGVFNILNTCVGGGTLSLPFAFAKCGWLVATILCLFSMICSMYSMNILCTMARKLGCSSYSDVMEKALGYNGKRLTTAILFFILSLVVIAFLVLLRDIASDVVEFFLPAGYHISSQLKNLITVVLTASSFPLMCSDNLHALRYVSYAGSVCVFILLLTVTHKTYLVNFTDVSSANQGFAPVGPARWGPKTFTDFFTAAPIIFISFLCQFNVLGVYSDLHKPTEANMGQVISVSMGTSAALFIAFGLAGYFFAYDNTADNILNNFPAHDPSVLIARVGLTLTLMCQLPMVMVPCRQALYPLIWPEINTADNHTLNLSEDAVANDLYASPTQGFTYDETNDSTNLIRKCSGNTEQSVLQAATSYRKRVLSFGQDTRETDGFGRIVTQDSSLVALDGGYAAYRARVLSFATDPEQAQEHFSGSTLLPVDRNFDIAITSATSRYLVTLVLVSIAFILAQTVPGVSTVWAIVGSSLGIAVAFLLPAYGYVCVWKNLGSDREVDSSVVVAYVMVGMSMVMIFVCTLQTLIKLF